MATDGSTAVFSEACGPLDHPAGGCATCAVRDRALCAALDAQEIKHVERVIATVARARGATIFLEGEVREHVYVLVSGAVRISKLTADGRRQIIGFLFPGDFLGGSACDDHTVTAEAVTDCRLCSFSDPVLRGLAERYPGLKDRLMANTSNELDQAREHILLLGQKTAQEKVASLIVGFAKRLTGEVRDGARFPMRIGRQDLADYLGVRIETVSRILSDYRRKGWISEEGGVMTLVRAGAVLAQTGVC